MARRLAVGQHPAAAGKQEQRGNNIGSNHWPSSRWGVQVARPPDPRLDSIPQHVPPQAEAAAETSARSLRLGPRYEPQPPRQPAPGAAGSSSPYSAPNQPYSAPQPNNQTRPAHLRARRSAAFSACVMLARSLPPLPAGLLPAFPPLGAAAALPPEAAAAALGLLEVAWQGPSEVWPEAGHTEPGREGSDSAAPLSVQSMLCTPRVEVGTMAGTGSGTGAGGSGRAAPSCRLLLCIRAATPGCVARQVGVSTPSAIPAAAAAPGSARARCSGSGSAGTSLPEQAGSNAPTCSSPRKALYVRPGRGRGKGVERAGAYRTD